MSENENIKYRQLYFDMEGNIKQETYIFHKEMSVQQKEQYEKLVADSNQMTIFDYVNE